jgi:gamma-glutamyltranspeptidase/glutathione hydrolase
MLSSMAPVILAKEGKFFLATGSPGGRTIINTVLQTIVNVVDYGMNAQEAVDAGRIHHQWFPDKLVYERDLISPDTIARLRAMGHETEAQARQGAAQLVLANGETSLLEGGSDRRVHDGAALGY